MVASRETRLLLGALLLSLGILAASWALVRQAAVELAKGEAAASTLRKLMKGELLPTVRPAQRNDPRK